MIKSDLDGGVFIANQTLVLQGVRRELADKYTCSATNTEGTKISNILHLKIKCKSKYKTITKWIMLQRCRTSNDPIKFMPLHALHWQGGSLAQCKCQVKNIKESLSH